MSMLYPSLSADALVKKFAPYTDELFKNESKREMVTNKDFSFSGAHSVLVYKVAAAPVYDYVRGGEMPADYDSRYGKIKQLDASAQEMMLSRDRSFIFFIDKLDEDETAQQLQAATALARQTREVVIPEIDAYTYGVMAEKAGTIETAAALTAENIYDSIIAGSEALDNAEVPETLRSLIVTPAVYRIMKKNPEIFMETNVGNEMRLKGVVGIVDGMTVQKIPANRLPEDFGFMIAHPSATVSPVKLEDYQLNPNTFYGSGTMVTGRYVYDAFVLDNKAKGIYYQPIE